MERASFLGVGAVLDRALRLISTPTSAMALRMGLSFWPRGVSAYSTVGGEVCFTSRVSTPLSSSSFRRVVRTLAETPPRSRFRSPKRRASWLKYQRIWGVQAPARSLRLDSRGQPWGTGPDLLARWRIMV